VERVGADAEVERVLARVLDDVLVGADTGGLERLGRDLLVLVRDEVDAERELVDAGLLATEVEDADLGVRDTAVVPTLGVGLVLAVAAGGREGRLVSTSASTRAWPGGARRERA